MMEEISTTVEDNSAANVIDATGQESQTTMEQQTADVSDNLDTSTSTDTSTTEQSTVAEDTSSATQFDADIDEWATKTGRQAPTSDSERALLQEVRNGQREYSRARQAKDVSKSVSDSISAVQPADESEEFIDPLEKDVRELKQQLAASNTARMQSEYVSEKGVTLEESTAMGDFLKEKVEKGGKAAFDYWTNPANLEDWHAMGKSRLAATSAGVDTEAIKAQAAQSERERIARESKANGPSRNASSTQTTTDKTAEQARLERFSSWD